MGTRVKFYLCGCAAISLALSACSSGNEAAQPAGEDDAAAAEVEAAPAQEAAQEVASAPADMIRGAGGLEEKCLAQVNDMVGGGVIGTNHIEEAESGVMIYVNVQGAEAPWQCFGYRDGTLDNVFYGGDEGAL